MKGRSSKQKGASGEREFRDLLRAHGFEAARHGRNSFGPDGERTHEDVTHNIRGIHFEVKRRETMDVPSWFAQARAEAPAKTPVIAWRSNRQPWRVILDAEDFLNLLEDAEYVPAKERAQPSKPRPVSLSTPGTIADKSCAAMNYVHEPHGSCPGAP